jgi:hypothetical protein
MKTPTLLQTGRMASLAGACLLLLASTGISHAQTKIPNKSITSAKLAPFSVKNSKLASGSVTTSKIADGSITTPKLANGSVTSTKIANNSVTTPKLANGSVTGEKLSLDLGLWGADGLDVYSYGNVGIGVEFPTTALDVNGAINVMDDDGRNYFGGLVSEAGAQLINFGINDSRFGPQSDSKQGGFLRLDTRGSAGGNLFQFFARPSGAANSGEVACITSSGNMGIGTNTPTRAKLEVIGSVSNPAANLGGSGLYYYISSGSVQIGNTAQNISIWASEGAAVGQIIVRSDVRTKTIIGQSDKSADLTTLNRIKITDYTDKDVVARGNRPYKKVIAQQVAEVYPQAISKHTDVVPDIYQKATIENGWVKVDADLKQGDRVRLIGEKSDGIHEVLEVAPGRFRTDARIDGTLFVYGREVKDFHMVDYDAISMLNVSASQELSRKVEALEKSNTEKDTALAAMTKRLAAYEAKDEARDAKLASIEAMLSADKSAVVPVSLKKGMARVD